MERLIRFPERVEGCDEFAFVLNWRRRLIGKHR